MLKEKTPEGVIEVDLFDEEVEGPDHPEAQKFRLLLEQVADDHDCELTFFQIEKGTVCFAFDNEELMTKVIKTMQEQGELDL
ncbi:MAG: hypothetical protein EHM45_01350 [Desulfobacteraceae bacterium]|nr:MAG: hypothetical protein EHM45_01350 [Desulfobacteraceae bacterium]